MHVISRRTIEAAKAQHANAANALDYWWRIASRAQWHNLHEVRQDFPAADQWQTYLIFDIRGNHYRLICGRVYAAAHRQGVLFVKFFLTHAEYDTDQWKNQLP